MAIPTNKEELLIAINTNYMKLKKELINIPLEKTDIKELEGHSKNTLISINNLLSYLIAWGELVLKWDKKKQNNQEVDFPETGYNWNQLGKLAQKFYEDYQNESFDTLVIKLDKVVDNILILIQSRTNKELYEVNWYKKWTLGRMIQLNTSSPYTNAKIRIRKWKNQSSKKLL
ncbi:MAG TPA: ClbS/DfsB family four-helix bundle protein [Aliarcobacter thereius]|uniref:ClbS/DfsB family four-helix bundle protein n=1 Tax=Aliarcobacter thereius TaxID=544718 RepID=A0A5R9H1H5_9BACT|nr:ClbS/DfsB family four-helix bundle protein [Aliarcobacter thereius]TLS70980.1 ClbS/DfsB family four-helix bundle protein [Aliarcobacter thereius]TLT06466.1 ClbS/DfsB family four-helix bundle protein [Aliarcobacter thereius]HJE02261.1 ClbS/DfsB family four-helix bundle protein [Aliarcobacter thereius]